MMQLSSPAKHYVLLPYKGDSNGRIIAHLGYNDHGKPFYINFSGKSHLIVAGKNGCGKTALLHDIICSLIQVYSADDIILALVTGEKSGFSNYKNVPHIIKMAYHKEEAVLECLKDVCDEIENRKQNPLSGTNTYKHLFLVIDGFSALSGLTRIRSIPYLKGVLSDGQNVNVHLIISTEEIGVLSPWNWFISAVPNRVVFACTMQTSSTLLGSEKAAQITHIGEAYAVLSDSPCLHFYSANPDVHTVVKPYNAQAEQKVYQEVFKQKQQKMQQSAFEQLDPYQFEEFVAQRMRECGYTKVQVTSKSGDYGADVLGVDSNGKNVCVQCKKYTGKVGFDAVQQINTARTLFNCERALLVTTSTLTQQAKETAKKLKVEVYERFNAGSKIN